MGLFFALLSALSFGISNSYWRYAEKGDDFSRIVFFRGLIVTPVLGLAWLLMARNKNVSGLFSATAPTALHYFQTMLICLLCSFGLFFFLRSLKYQSTGISTVLSSINLFSVLTAVLVIGETFYTGYIPAFLLAGAGIVCCNPVSVFKKGWNRGLLYSLAASFCWGCGYALFRYPADWLGAPPLSFILECTVTLLALGWNRITAQPPYRISFTITSKQFRHYLILAFLLIGGSLFYNLAIRTTPVLLLNLTGNLSLVFTVLFSWYWHQERLKLKQLAGILFILASLLLSQLIR